MTGGVTKSRLTNGALPRPLGRSEGWSRSNPIDAILATRSIVPPFTLVPVHSENIKDDRCWPWKLADIPIWFDDASIPRKLVLDIAYPVPNNVFCDPKEVIDARFRIALKLLPFITCADTSVWSSRGCFDCRTVPRPVSLSSCSTKEDGTAKKNSSSSPSLSDSVSTSLSRRLDADNRFAPISITISFIETFDTADGVEVIVRLNRSNSFFLIDEHAPGVNEPEILVFVCERFPIWHDFRILMGLLVSASTPIGPAWFATITFPLITDVWSTERSNEQVSLSPVSVNPISVNILTSRLGIVDDWWIRIDLLRRLEVLGRTIVISW